MSVPLRHKLKTVNAKCVEENYGKNPLSKECLFTLRVLSFRIHSTLLSDVTQVQEQSK